MTFSGTVSCVPWGRAVQSMVRLTSLILMNDWATALSASLRPYSSTSVRARLRSWSVKGREMREMRFVAGSMVTTVDKSPHCCKPWRTLVMTRICSAVMPFFFHWAWSAGL